MPVYCSKHNTEMTIDQNYNAYCSECCEEAIEKYIKATYPSVSMVPTTTRDYFTWHVEDLYIKAYDAAYAKAVYKAALDKVENNEDDDEGVL